MKTNAFVTGGSRGIGRAVVLKFAREGIGCAFTYCNNPSAADETIKMAQAINPDVLVKAYQLDVKRSERVEEVVQRAAEDFGNLHILVNNAGVVINNAAVMTSNEEWDETITTNLSGSFYVTREFLMHALSHKQGGQVIAISSLARGGSSGQAAYAASKAGLVGLMNTIAKEYGPKGIRANVISPGFIETDMTDEALSKKLKEYWLKFCPIRRSGCVDDVANLVYFLTSEEGSFINGEVINLTGGLNFAP